MNEQLREQNIVALLDAIEDAVLLLSRDGRVVLANQAAVRRLGAGRADIAGQTLLELDMAPAAAKLWMQWLVRVADVGRPAYFEDEAETYVHDIAMFPVKGGGRAALRVAVVVRDVTQARRDRADLLLARRKQADMADRLESLEKHLKDRNGRGAMLGGCPAMEETFARMDQAASLDVPVLIVGEPGTGKALAAQVIHQTGDRSAGPLERVDCTNTDEAHLESEIFGHARGGFGGNERARKGRLEAADTGTLLLVGVEGLSLRLQQKLRLFLEQGVVEPLGGGESIPSDVRIIVSTRENLMELSRQDRFREDLSYLLRVMVIPLPPLRKRAEDITLLAEHFLTHYGTALRKGRFSLSAEAMQAMLTHPWPGNVRELRHAMEHAAIRCAGVEILPLHLPSEVVAGPRTIATGRRADRDAVLRALDSCRWNKTRAARLLGISRGTLYTRMKAFGLHEKNT